MQNRPPEYYKVVYDHQEFPNDFPVYFMYSSPYSPPSGPVSFMHYHNCLEIGYCYMGCGIFFIDGKVLPFSQGDSSIIFENQIHIAQSDMENPSQWKFVNIDILRLLSGFDLKNIDKLTEILEKVRSNKNIFEKNHISGCSELICEIITELENQKENYTLMVKSLMYQLLLKLSRESGETIEGRSSKSFQSIIKVSPSLKYISDNYASNLSMDYLAQLCSMSMTNFRRIFKFTMGMPPSEYLHLVRIKMASTLLANSNDSILEISLKVGYTSLSSFNRKFVSIMGMPPRDWRKRKMKPADIK